MADPYEGREQTGAKHYILKRYLQALSFKILNFSDLTYVDGFSGPWKSSEEQFEDTSFMIAIEVLMDAQRKIFERDKVRKKIRCFFCEANAETYVILQKAVERFHDPSKDFEITTYRGDFETAIAEIQKIIGASFPLIFIDPTGWTGYSLEKIKPLFNRSKCEVLINFMYDHINRFAHSPDESTIASLNPILGGPGWVDRLDPSLSRGAAVEKLFRHTLKSVGDFRFVISTRIDKATHERPHFFIVYGTKNRSGLIEFRNVEYIAQRKHVKNTAKAKAKKLEVDTGTEDMFTTHHIAVKEDSFDYLVNEQILQATASLKGWLSDEGPLLFSIIVERLLEIHMLRETNIKDICVELAQKGEIANTWGDARHKPKDGTMIQRKPAPAK